MLVLLSRYALVNVCTKSAALSGRPADQRFTACLPRFEALAAPASGWLRYRGGQYPPG
jgi:hypothetical protein